MNGKKAKALRREFGDHSLQDREQKWSVSKIVKTGKTGSDGTEVTVRKGVVRCVGTRAAYQAAKRGTTRS